MGKLAESMSVQRRFLADAAHELRTPMTALRLQVQLLERAQDEASRREAVAELEYGVARSAHLVEQLLQVARSGPDGQPVRIEPVDLGELVRSVVGRMSVKAEAKHIDLGAQTGKALRVDGDPQALLVLLNNLVENALRYTPAGGTVDVGAALREGHAVLYVVDDGPGIPEAERPRVFDRFYRGADRAAGAGDGGGGDSGSGLGLAIVKAIAQRHGAQVSLHTPVSGRGLEVLVVFAAAPA
jgi:signal transduction histidine kinase